MLQDMKRTFRSTAITFFFVLFAGLLLTQQAVTLAQLSKTVSSIGFVKTVGIEMYSDVGLKNSVSSIDWGSIAPGSTKNVIVYIRNEGDSAVNLIMNSSNWTPSNASTYMTLTWNYLGQSINAGTTIQVTFSLSVMADIQGITNFSFDIIIECK